MAGIYLHIPFCRRVCYYCDFFFTVSVKHQERFVKCLKAELVLQSNYLKREKIETIYFGGGTPSVIPPKDIQDIIELIHNTFKVIEDAEITLEANPDDLTIEYLNGLKQTKINRLSIGVQSFYDEDLKWMNRRHNGEEAKQSIINSQDAGFENMNVDLIYGFPLLTHKKWEKNVRLLLDMDVPHISSYLLGIEPKTVFGVMKEKGKLELANDNHCIRQFYKLTEMTEKVGFLHYEISNFCKPGFFSKHNTAYWFSKKYLGLGPSANSYDENSRQWNVRSLEKYLVTVEKGEIPSEKEELSLNSKYNDYIITSLRTMWGADLGHIKTTFGECFFNHFQKESENFINRGMIRYQENKMILTKEGMTVSDTIIRSLMFV